MATRSKATFQKRQKEMKRLEKQRMKADRRAQRNMAKRAGVLEPTEDVAVSSEDVADVPVESEVEQS
jgi:cell division septum initiation protein DivIVA